MITESTSVPKVSVVVPNYNHARFLRQRIDSILGQTFQDFEMILMDDCSVDESRTILASYTRDPRVRMELNSTNSGSPFKQWNKGVRMARGEYVWIAESDDYADPRFLQRLVAILAMEPRVQFAYCRSWRVSETGRLDGFGDCRLGRFRGYVATADFRLDGCEMCRKYLCAVNVIVNASSVLFRRDAYEQVGGADEALFICGDWKLWGAVALEGSVAYVCEPLNYFRFHSETVRSRTSLARTDVGEHLSTSRWILDRVGSPHPEISKSMRGHNAWLWAPAVLDRRLPWHTKREILRRVTAVDPHPVRSFVWFVYSWTWEKTLSKLWYASLKLTYRVRLASGLTRGGFSELKAKFGMGRAR